MKTVEKKLKEYLGYEKERKKLKITKSAPKTRK